VGDRVYVNAENGGTINAIDTRTNKVVRSVPVTAGPDSAKPSGIAVSSDGKTVYFANGRANRVAVMTAATMAITDTIPVGKRPWGVALAADGKTFYTADGRSNSVSVIDLAGKKVARTVPVGDHPYGVVLLYQEESRKAGRE
jgi:YVTN family beta-propeller protein